MLMLSQVFSLLLAGLALGQVLLACGFVWRLLRFKRQLIANEQAPQAAIILCLRGGDPFLRDCLRGLLQQDYPHYEIRLVVDHRDDPAMSVIREFMVEGQAAPFHIEYLAQPGLGCSLKCSSVVQAVRGLDDSVKFIALCDADTIAHTSWLRELATALGDARVGAATGNRWYMPASISVAALIRYAWNAAAIVQMYWYRIAWGGTLAIKTSVLRETDLLERWSHAFCEDTMLYSHLKKSNLRLAFVPSLMMVNREGCDLRGYFSWVRRQLLTARLYHPAWAAVATHGLLTTAGPLAVLTLGIGAWLSREDTAAALTLSSLFLYQLAIMLMLIPMELAVRRIVAARGDETRWLGPVGVVKTVVAILLTQVVYGAALYSASRLRQVDWRGVHYRFDRSGKVQLVEYRRYSPVSGSTDSSL
ncbi:MAG: glycosyltransferase family 2 protein [Planctomycetales bacterium]|nr:glycosyltransferase family 2 protein [Planctomycetales bacterium]